MDPMLLSYTPRRLSSYVEALWCYDADRPAHSARERVLPNGRFQIVIDLSSGHGTLCGMQSQYIAIEPAAIQCVIGVVFRPGGARGFVPAPCSAFYNQYVSLDAVWNATFIDLRDRLRGTADARSRLNLLEEALVDTVRRHDEARFVLHPCVEHALREFRRQPGVCTVNEVASATGWSRRRLTQVFDEQIGMTPKRYCRLTRFQRIVRRVAVGGPVNWAAEASASGYYDQAHLAHEFRDFSGLSLSEYLAAERPSANHVRLD